MRKKLFKLHSYIALVCLLPIFIVSVTGSILVFKAEIDAWMMPGVASLDKSIGESRKNINQLKKNVEEANPNFVVGSWEIFNDGIQADRVYLIKKGTDDWYKIFFDPFAGSVLSEPVSTTSYLTDWLLNLHYTFLLNGIGSEESQLGTLIGIFVAIFLTFLGVSGLILHRKFWKKFFTLRWGSNWRIFSGDFHRLAGLWSSPVVLTLGLTGLYFNAIEYYHEVFQHGEEGHYHIETSLHSPDINFQFLLEDSQKQLGEFSPTYLLFPYEPDVDITVFGYQPGGNPFASNYASTVTYNKQTGELIAAIDGRKANTVLQITDSFRELHFGSFAGLSSKLVWSILGFFPLLLGVSGLYLWFYRRSKKQGKLTGAMAFRERSTG